MRTTGIRTSRDRTSGGPPVNERELKREKVQMKPPTVKKHGGPKLTHIQFQFQIQV